MKHHRAGLLFLGLPLVDAELLDVLTPPLGFPGERYQGEYRT